MFTLPRWCLPLFFTLIGAVAAYFLVPAESAAVREHLGGFPDAHIWSHRLRPPIVGFLCFMPAIAAIAYTLGSSFDRYLSREFLKIFGVCLAALFAIWLLLDLNDNLGDFSGSPHLLYSVALFYLFRAPAILIVLVPYTLLLSLIYCLGKLSKSNEIIAMVQSGTSIVRVSASLIFAGAWCSVALLGLNYHWAPHAEGMRKELIAEAKGLPITAATHVLFRNSGSGRLWMVGAFPEHYRTGEPLQNLEITTLRDDQTIKSRMRSSSATYSRMTKEWTFSPPLFTHFTPGEAPIFEQMDAPLIRKTWSETPAQIIKPGLAMEYQGIPELSTWLSSPIATQTTANLAGYLTHWHYRWALPATCLVTVLLAAPLSIHFARRGSGSGIFVAVLLSMLMMFFASIALALGEAGVMNPILSAWLPNLVFTCIGLWLYHRRITGRPIYQTVRRLLTFQS